MVKCVLSILVCGLYDQMCSNSCDRLGHHDEQWFVTCDYQLLLIIRIVITDWLVHYAKYYMLVDSWLMWPSILFELFLLYDLSQGRRHCYQSITFLIQQVMLCLWIVTLMSCVVSVWIVTLPLHWSNGNTSSNWVMLWYGGTPSIAK